MYQKFIDFLQQPPPLYAPSSSPFWDDEHISAHMLEAHLNPNEDGASRKHAFIRKSVEWISQYCGVATGMPLLDLGCGPGLYAEYFCEQGFAVTGLDLSARSICHAKERATARNFPIQYRCQNYLTMNDRDQFDVATLIYCDFGVLPPQDRKALLHNIYRSLKPNGTLILDGFTANALAHFEEKETVQYANSGFWSQKPHVCIQRNILYPQTNNYLEQYVIVTDDNCQCYNNWNQIFTVPV